jgi:hypothetical protein
MEEYDLENENKKDNIFMGCCAIFICCLTIIVLIIAAIIIVVPTFFSIYYTQHNDSEGVSNGDSKSESFELLQLGKPSKLCDPINYIVSNIPKIECMFTSEKDAVLVIKSNIKTYYKDYISLPNILHIKLNKNDKILSIRAKSDDNCKILVVCQKN